MSSYHFAAIIDSEAIAHPLSLWREEFPEAGVLALVAEQDRQQVPLLQALCRACDLPLLGGVFPSLHLDGQIQPNGVLLILLDPMADFYRLLEFHKNDNDSEQQVRALAGQIRERLHTDEPATLLLAFDAFVPNISTLLETLYLQLAESVHYAGGNAGSGSFRKIPCLFDSERLIENGLLAILFRPHQGGVLEHGYQAPDKLIAATATDGNRIISIGWQPAFDVYRDHIEQLYGVEVTSDNFFDNAVHFPFGILRADDEVLVRIPVAVESDGSLFCIGEVPENTLLTLLEAPAPELLQTPQRLAARMDSQGRCVLNFYCAGRRGHLGSDAAAAELVGLQQALDCRVLLGVFSLGEIGSSQHGGYPLFHHASLVCMNL